MKYLGIAVVLVSTTGLGAYTSHNLKRRAQICRDLISLCDILSIDIKNKINSLPKLLENRRFDRLAFLSFELLKRREKVNSPLSQEENNLISDFFFSLGKSDSASQLKLIEAFKENMERSREKYEEEYAEKSKLYLAFGLFGGMAFSLIII